MLSVFGDHVQVEDYYTCMCWYKKKIKNKKKNGGSNEIVDIYENMYGKYRYRQKIMHMGDTESQHVNIVAPIPKSPDGPKRKDLDKIKQKWKEANRNRQKLLIFFNSTKHFLIMWSSCKLYLN